MALSNVTYTANGSTTIFVVAFGFLQESHVTVTIDNVVTTAYTFTLDGNIEFTVAPPDQSVVYITRDSDISQILVAYGDGSNLSQEDLNNDANQSIFLQQETRDKITTINADNSAVVGRVDTNEAGIANNVANISTNVTAISTNATNIGTNVTNISSNATAITNVDNTSDVNKPVSTATQTALDLKVDNTSITNVDNTSDAAKPVSTATQTSLDLKLNATAVTNVDNTSDVNKPVSTATQTALDLKLNQTSNVELTMQEIATPSTPASGYKSIYPKTDGKLYTLDDGGNEVEVGSGGGAGGINYMVDDNTSAETTVGDWVTYADAAGANPVDGTAGTATTTYTRNTVTPMRGLADFKMVKDAANRQGEGASCAFTVDVADQAKRLTCSFDYDASHAGYADDDIRLSVYDVTNSKLIRVNGEDLKGGNGSHIFQFQTASDSVSYRLIMHVSSTSAVAYDVYFDNIQVGPREVVKGAAMTDWKDYTPVAEGVGTISSVDMRYRRVGSNLQIRGEFTTGATSAVTFKLYFPTGLIADSSLPSSNQHYGRVVRNAGASAYTKDMLALSAANLAYIGITDPTKSSTTAPDAMQNASSYFGASNRLTVHLDIPIQGWSSNAVSSEDLGGREIVVSGVSNLGDIITANTERIDFTLVEDTSGSWSTTNNGTDTFTAPETGRYSFEGIVNISGSIQAGIRLLIDNAVGRYVGGLEAASGIRPFSGIVSLNKGQTLSFVSDSGITLLTSTTNHHVTIVKLASPQTQLGTETVAARYTSNSGQTVAANGTVLYEDIDYDTHNAYDIATGKYTVVVNGKYAIEALIGGASSSYKYVAIRKNGTYIYSNYIDSAGVADNGYITVSDKPELVKGDYIEIIVRDLGFSLTADSSVNVFSIARIK